MAHPAEQDKLPAGNNSSAKGNALEKDDHKNAYVL
jgi:hypothetical protein